MVKIIVFSVLTVLVVVAAAVTLRQPLDSSAATVAYSSAGSASAGHPSAFAAADSADLLQRVAQLEVRLEQEIATRAAA